MFIGAGFISLQLAMLLASRQSDGREYTIVELLDHPLPLMLDSDSGKRVQDHLQAKGLTMRMGETVARIVGREGRVTGVELESGEQLPADVVFLNVGARANTQLAEASRLGRPPHLSVPGAVRLPRSVRRNPWQSPMDPPHSCPPEIPADRRARGRSRVIMS